MLQLLTVRYTIFQDTRIVGPIFAVDGEPVFYALIWGEPLNSGLASRRYHFMVWCKAYFNIWNSL